MSLVFVSGGERKVSEIYGSRGIGKPKTRRNITYMRMQIYVLSMVSCRDLWIYIYFSVSHVFSVLEKRGPFLIFDNASDMAWQCPQKIRNLDGCLPLSCAIAFANQGSHILDSWKPGPKKG